MKYKKIILMIMSIIILTSTIFIYKYAIKNEWSKEQEYIDSKINDERYYIPGTKYYTYCSSENANFPDKSIYSMLKEAYAKIDFFGEFKKGDIETYACYKEQYLKLLKGEVTFFDSCTQKEYYIYEFGEMNYTFPDTNELI